jgi:hypothetical protein
MKKVFLLFIGLGFIAVNAFSQIACDPPQAAWAFPAVYEMDEEVTFYIDLSNSCFTEGEDIYWWVWQPSEPDFGNDAESSEFAKWTYDGNMIWKKTFVPTEYFGMSKEAMLAYSEKAFWCNVKTKFGSLPTTKQTDTFKFDYPARTVAEIPDGNLWANDPTDFTVLTQTSVYFDSKLATGFTPGEDVFFNSQINNPEGDDYVFNYDPANPAKTKMVYLGDGIYRKDLAIKDYYFVPNADDPSVSIVNENYDLKYVKGNAVNGKGAETDPVEFAASSLDPGIPAVYLLPSNLTFYDIFAINRVNPQKGEDPITYTVTCSGYPTITGQLARVPNSGADKNRAVFIYFPQYWETAPTGQIRIRLTGANGERFHDQRITLMPVEE